MRALLVSFCHKETLRKRSCFGLKYLLWVQQIQLVIVLRSPEKYAVALQLVTNMAAVVYTRNVTLSR